jgi:iron complex outermembrane recepter protein
MSKNSSTASSIAVMIGLLWFGTAGLTAEVRPSLSESEREARIEELQRTRLKVEQELRQLHGQPEGVSRSSVPRSELSDQPTRSIKESLESVPGVVVHQGQSGRDVQLSIRGSK